MSQDDQPNREEKVIRGLLRLPQEMSGPFARLHQDEADFLRRMDYRGTGLPENGISIFRECKFKSLDDFFRRLGSKKACGVSESTLGALLDNNFNIKISGESQEHISLRCPDCDMSDVGGVCKPINRKSLADCPFFDKTDPLNLNSFFREAQAPAFRTGGRKSKSNST
jgi:hypothetical protein